MERKTDEDDKKDDEDNDNKGGCCCPERWVLAVMGFFGFIFVYALRVNLSVAIVCMVRPENSTLNSTDTQCSALDAGSDLSSRGEFDWDKNIQSGMLSSFFYGYMVTQIPGGWLAGRFGGKMVIWTGMLIVATANLLLPELARVDYRFVYGLRALMGLAQGVSFPSMHAMWGKWAPPVERSRLASLTYAGLMVGNIVTFIFSGYLCKYGFDNGWGSVFYVTGGAAFIWLLAWWIVVSDTPESNPRISRAEREYIQKSIGDIPNKQYTIPWKAMLTSQALFACLVAHVCNNWTHYTLVTSLPTFMKEALHYNIEENGLLSAVPYMSMLVTSLTVSHVADFVRSHWLSTRVTRRLFQVIAFSGICGCLIGTGFIDCENRTYAVVMLALAVGFEGLCYSGYVVNHIDFAPRYAGVLYGITNMFSTIPGIVAPEVAGALTPNKTQEEWRNVFFVCGGFAIFGAIVFGFCAQGELEPWAKEEGDDLSQEIVVSSEYGSRDNIAFDSKSSLDDYAIEENGLSGTRL